MGGGRHATLEGFRPRAQLGAQLVLQLPRRVLRRRRAGRPRAAALGWRRMRLLLLLLLPEHVALKMALALEHRSGRVRKQLEGVEGGPPPRRPWQR